MITLIQRKASRIGVVSSFSLGVMMWGLLIVGAGCERPDYNVVEETVTMAPVTEDELDVLWDQALSTLRKFDFQPDRQDRANGVIESLPTTSQQWGEFWRQDVADSYSLAASSMHTTQRKATVRFVNDNGAWRIEAQVDVYRLSVPESQVTTASSALQSFSGVLPTTQGQMVREGRSARHWVHLGRDEAMEARLLDRIIGWYPNLAEESAEQTG